MKQSSPVRPVSLAMILALTACAQWDEQAPPPEPTPPPAETKVEPPPPPPPRPQRNLQVRGLRPEPRPASEPQIAGIVMPPGRLVGLSERDTTALLGAPSEEDVTPPGKVWIYHADGCRLSVHLFPDMEKGGFYTLDYTADNGRDACLDKVMEDMRRRNGSGSREVLPSQAG